MDILKAFILGVVEGLTEFLPISSTGHLILVSHILGIEQTQAHKMFEVVIQLGSILAVVFLYKDKFSKDFELWKKLLIAFFPTGALGFFLYKTIKSLFIPNLAAIMLIVGGIIFIIVELLYRNKKHEIDSLEKIPYWKAFLIGVFQSFAMVPGTSRSGATIIGGLILGLDRKTATEFSFLLAVPTMIVATVYDVYKNYEILTFENWQHLIVGFITAFIFAIISIKLFLGFVKRFSFIPFGIYRIIIGIVFLYFGLQI